MITNYLDILMHSFNDNDGESWIGIRVSEYLLKYASIASSF